VNSHLHNIVDVYIDLGGFGREAVTRSNSPSIAGFMKNLRPFFKVEGIEVRTICTVAYSTQTGGSGPDIIRESLDVMFAKHRAQISWSRRPPYEVLQELIMKELDASRLAHHVMLVTSNVSFADVLEILKKQRRAVLVCGKTLDPKLRRGADRSILVAHFVPA
jgi:hypothetical protein